MRTAADLPDDVDELKRRLLAAEAGLFAKTLEAEKLKFELARLKRMAFGQSSERLDRQIEQLELKLEEIEATTADTALPSAVPGDDPVADSASQKASEKKPRRQFPAHLPRVTETHEPTSCTCPRCGTDRMRKVGEDVILSPRPRDWKTYLASAPAASDAFMSGVEDLPVQERDL